MNKVVANIHFIFIFLGAFWVYETYTNYELEFEQRGHKERNLKRKIKSHKSTLSEVKRYRKDIEFAKESIELVAQEVERIQKQLPSIDTQSQDLKMMQDLARSLNMKEVEIKVLDEKENGFYLVKRYSVSGLATFLQYLIFFEKLGDKERIFNIESVEMDRSEDSQRGRFELVKTKLVLSTYRYNAKFKEDRGIEKIEKEFK